MTNETKDTILSLTSGGLGAFGSICLIISFFYNRHIRTPATFKVFIMSICDLPLALIMPGLTGGPCVLAAFATTFFIVATCSWYFLLAFDLHQILNGRGVPKDVSMWAHLFAWLPSTIAATVPYVVNSYGKPENEDWLICWFSKSNDIYKLTVVVPVGCHILFTLVLVAEYFCKGKRVLSSSAVVQRRVGRHLFLFVVVFLSTWGWLIISTVQNLIRGQNRIAVLDDIAFFLFKSSGFLNFIVWVNSPVFNHARLLKLRKEQKHLRNLPSNSTSQSSGFLSSDTDSEDDEVPVQGDRKKSSQ